MGGLLRQVHDAPQFEAQVSKQVYAVADEVVRRTLGQEHVWWLTAGLVFTVWQVSGVARAIMGVLSEIYGDGDRRSFKSRYATSIALGTSVTVLVLQPRPLQPAPTALERGPEIALPVDDQRGEARSAEDEQAGKEAQPALDGAERGLEASVPAGVRLPRGRRVCGHAQPLPQMLLDIETDDPGAVAVGQVRQAQPAEDEREREQDLQPALLRLGAERDARDRRGGGERHRHERGLRLDDGEDLAAQRLVLLERDAAAERLAAMR